MRDSLHKTIHNFKNAIICQPKAQLFLWEKKTNEIIQYLIFDVIYL